jgi:DNA-binding NtrC family response regulator
MTDSDEPKGHILVVDDEASAREALKALLEDTGYAVETAPEGFKALGILEEWECDVLLTDLRMPMMDGLELIQKAQNEDPGLACIVMTAFGSIENAVEAMKAGADDYVTKPLSFDAVEILLDRTMQRLEMQRELQELRDQDQSERRDSKIVGNSPAIEEVTAMIDQVAGSQATVLVTGESGTGKELVAERIHEQSDRAERPLVRLHCAALTESLLESELFGHEEGAFTGATDQRKGRFEQADGGTLFLDEIGEIPKSTQVKLLRFLQQKEFERVGGNETISVDVRIIAATNRDLDKEVREGNFREDLYYRLNVINIHIPALRARRDDIPILVHHFITKYAEQNDTAIEEITPDAMDALQDYEWPGNVRELENTIERAVVLANEGRISLDHLPSDFGQAPFSRGSDIRIPGSTLEDIERFAILRTYESTGGSTSETADILGVSVRKIQYKIKEYEESWENNEVESN